jgi:ferredoxin-like protein FixX
MDPDVKINSGLMEDLSEADKEEFAKSCPTKVYAYDQNKGQVKVEDAVRCTYCNEVSIAHMHELSRGLALP